jgi:hypothetical protein
MQKTGKNASILIWSIFLSIIISLWFISISTQINKTLKNNKNIQQEISQSNQLESILKSDNPISQQLENGMYLNIPDQNSYMWSLKQNEIKSFTFSWSTLDFINISINSGGPIKYKYEIWTVYQQYDTLTSWSVSFSWNINTQSTLEIENLWWYTLFQVNSDQNFIAPERYYEVWKKVGNKNVLIQNSQIK